MATIHRRSATPGSPTWDWSDAPATEYRSEAAPGVVRHVLVGPEDGATEFVVRHFTVPAGGHTALDRHPHEHGVVIAHGTGSVLLGEEWHAIGEGDSVFVPGDLTHQFEAGPDGPLTFICVITSGIPG